MGKKMRIFKRRARSFFKAINPVAVMRERRERELFSKSSYISSYDEWLSTPKKYKI